MSTTPLPLLVTDLTRNAATPLHVQLYAAVRHAILDGRLAPGARLPATRTLASELEVSRNTVLTAYDQLHAEGYLDGRTGAGSFVTSELPVPRLPPRRTSGGVAMPPEPGARGRMLSSTPVTARSGQLSRAFRIGLPALDAFPSQAWGRLMARAWRDVDRASLGYADAGGHPPLREAIADYLRTSRAVRCDASQVIVTNGAQHALHLVAQVLLDPGDTVWFEDPGYRGARSAFQSAGLDVVPIPIDDEGLQVAVGQQMAPNARAAYVTPSHQYPLGVTMSLARRLQLLAWAAARRAWIVEDDYDSEYRYAGRPLASLQGLDTADRVIYVGTFSKVLCPALRLGYVVVPKPLSGALLASRGVMDRHNASVDQMALTRFMDEGHFARHIRRMRALYQERQATLVTAAEKALRGRLEVTPRPAGLHLIGWLPEGADDRVASELARRHGVDAPALSSYAIGPTATRPGLLLGYANVAATAIRTGVRDLAAALSESPTRPARLPRRR